MLAEGSACGIDLNRFKPSKELCALGMQTRVKYEIPQDAIVIGYVGRVVPDKGIEILVQAFENVQSQIQNTYLLLVVEFETVRETISTQTINRIKSSEHILFNGEFISDILPFYAAMDIVILPSRREGFGLVLLEAAAMGLPTVATRVTGCVDAVDDNKTGLLFEVDNKYQLAQALLKLVKEPQLRKKLGLKGQKRVCRSFDAKLLIKKHLDLYTELFGKNNG